MKFTVNIAGSDLEKSDCLILGCYENGQTPAGLKDVHQHSKNYIQTLFKRGDFKGKLCETMLLLDVPNLKTKRLLLVGLGKQQDLSETQYVNLIRTVFANFINNPVASIANTLTLVPVSHFDEAWKIRQTILIINNLCYRFDRFKTNNNQRNDDVKNIILASAHKKDLQNLETVAKQSVAMAQGMKFTKDLANTPANVCTPTYIAEQVRNWAKEKKHIKVTIMDEKAIKKNGLRSLLAVAQGSQQPPRFIVIEYQRGKKESPTVLVGKGITFDSGGLFLKPALNMLGMKYDMCGAASVLGVLMAIDELKLNSNVIGVLACAENMLSGNSTRPGDVVETLSGQTVEINNTDAEGRLALCDALSYIERFKPRQVIDVATLTGSIVFALGYHMSGLFSNYQPLADELKQAAKQTYDKVWQMPLSEEYKSALDSAIADVSNIGPDTAAGNILAATFLARFTEKYHWAHLDIAGTAWSTGRDKLATARPVPLLVQFLLNKSTH